MIPSARSLSLYTLTLCAALGIGASPAAADSENWQGLVTNSPFGTAAAPQAKKTGAELEFRGYVQEGDVMFFNVYDPAQKTARWIAKDQESPGLEVVDYDEPKRLLIIRTASGQSALPLKQAAVTLVAATPPAPPTPDGPQPETLNTTPEEKSNLQKIAEEIRRRRAMRSQVIPATRPVAPAEPHPGPDENNQ